MKKSWHIAILILFYIRFTVKTLCKNVLHFYRKISIPGGDGRGSDGATAVMALMVWHKEVAKVKEMITGSMVGS